MHETPNISIIIPVYNTERFLDKCLHSVINQTYKNLEIIVVNDGSTDNSLAVVQKFSSIDSRIKIINKQNGGLSSARNAGIREASGEYVLHVDSDDWIEPAMCDKLLKSALSHNSQIVISDVFFETNNRQFIRKEPYDEEESSDSFLQHYLFQVGLNSVCNKLFSLSLYKENNLLHYEDIALGEDSSCLLRLIAKANTISSVKEPLYHYNMKSFGMSRGIKKDIMQYYTGISRVEKFYIDNSISTQLFPFIRFKIAYSELSRCSLRKANELGYSDYAKIAKLFISDIKNIKTSPEYKNLKLKYRAFINLYKFYYFLSPKKYR